MTRAAVSPPPTDDVLPGTSTAGRTGMWQADPGLGIYLHVPFCAHRCHYCDFNTYEGLDRLHRPYVEALKLEIARWRDEWGSHRFGTPAPDRAVTSIFFGGGTPTLLPPHTTGMLLDTLTGAFEVVPDAEITIEANPETVDLEHLAALRDSGFTRVSVGVQSLVPTVLEGLGRTHGPDRALKAIEDAMRAGFDDVNADLIYGSPWESDAAWQASVEGIAAISPAHVSAYALTVEQGTPLATLVATGRVADIDPDLQAARWELVSERLGAAGYERYEISNWAQNGHSSRHNVLYWSAGDYVAFGAGAHGHVDGVRWWRTKRPRDYIDLIANGRSTIAGHEVVEWDRRPREALMLGLRLAEGIRLAEFAQRWSRDALDAVMPEIDRLAEQGLLECTPRGVRLAAEATLVADEVIRRLL